MASPNAIKRCGAMADSVVLEPQAVSNAAETPAATMRRIQFAAMFFSRKEGLFNEAWWAHQGAWGAIGTGRPGQARAWSGASRRQKALAGTPAGPAARRGRVRGGRGGGGGGGGGAAGGRGTPRLRLGTARQWPGMTRRADRAQRAFVNAVGRMAERRAVGSTVIRGAFRVRRCRFRFSKRYRYRAQSRHAAAAALRPAR